jgi:hypothetical protein
MQRGVNRLLPTGQADGERLTIKGSQHHITEHYRTFERIQWNGYVWLMYCEEIP